MQQQTVMALRKPVLKHPQKSSSRDFLISDEGKSHQVKLEKLKPMLAKVSTTTLPFM